MSANTPSYDLIVVGAGIVGLATALAGLRRKLEVAVIERDAQANGASVRNFGFVVVTGQERHTLWRRARRSREVWAQLAADLEIPVLHRGLWLCARRPESLAVVEEFLRTDMAQGCRLLSPAEARGRAAFLRSSSLLGVLESDTELRVESRTAIPRLASWLEHQGVVFLRERAVQHIELPNVTTSRGVVRAQRVAVCPGDDFTSLYAERLARYSLTRCKLQMLRLAAPGYRLPAALMSDLGLARYEGYADLPAASALKHRLAQEQPRHLQHGVHLIVVQSADGTLVVGDSHHDAATPDPFARQEIDDLILQEFREAVGQEPPPVTERWIGTYASAPDRAVLFDQPAAGVAIAVVTCGAGASTGFAIGEELVDTLFDSTPSISAAIVRS